MKPKGDYGPEYQRRVQLRNRLFRDHVKLNPRARHARGSDRKALLDRLEREHLTPRVWNWTFDHHAPGNPKSWVSDRDAYKLYKAAVKLRAQQLRALRQYNTARMLDAHISSLIDVAPRAAWCYYPNEWKEISRALRPFGSNPPPGGSAAKLYAIYQRIRSQHTVEKTP